MESYFITKTLPMIKIATIENKPFQEGIDIIGKIVSKRADLALFDEDVLETDSVHGRLSQGFVSCNQCIGKESGAQGQ